MSPLKINLLKSKLKKRKRKNKAQGEEWHWEDWERNSTFYLCLGIFPLLPAGFFTRQSQFAWVCQPLCAQPTESDIVNQYCDKSNEKSHSNTSVLNLCPGQMASVFFSKEYFHEQVLQNAHRQYLFDLPCTEIPHGLSTMTNAGVWIFIWHSFHSILIKEEDWERHGLFASGKGVHLQRMPPSIPEFHCKHANERPA